MVWANCNLILNSDSTRSFYAGDIVTGSLNLELTQEQLFKRIDFKVIGISKARWTRSAPTMPFIKIYSERRKEFEMSVDVFNELCGKKVPAGIYIHNFHFLLPSDIPPSFTSSFASTRYFVKLKAKAKSRLTKKKWFPFIVLHKVDMSQLDCSTPLITEIYKKISRTKEINMSLKTCKGITPNQRVPFEIIIQNSAGRIKISKIRVFLIQKRQYRICSGYLNEEKEISYTDYKKFLNISEEFCYFTLNIPLIFPSLTNSNSIVSVCYAFRVQVCFKSHFKVVQDVPVVAATVPRGFG